MEATHYFLTQDGQLKAVAPGGLELAKDSGWKPVGTDLEEARALRDAGSTTGQLKTAASGFASGAIDAITAIPRAASALGSAALGTENPLADMTGRGALETGAYVAGGEGIEGAKAAQKFAAAERIRATMNPGTALASSMVGQVAGAVATSGIGAGLGSMATKGLGGGLAARIAGGAVTGAFEGAPLNLVAAQDQAYIDNRQLTGEQALAAMGTGALLGGGLGVAARGLGELGTVFRRTPIEEAEASAATKANHWSSAPIEEGEAGAAAGTREAIFEEAAPKESLLRRATRTSDEAINNSVTTTLRQEAMPETASYVRKAIGGENIAEIRSVEQGEAARELRTHINQMEEATSNLTPEWRELKASNVAKTIATGDEAFTAQSELAQNQIGTIRAKIDELRGDPLGYSQVGLKKLDDKVALAERKLGAAIESGKGEELMVTLDGLKRDMGPHGRGGDFGMSQAERATKNEVRGLYEDLRQSLMTDTWGEAGQMQRDVNAPFTKWLGTKKLFDQRFLTETGREGWERTVGADPAKIEPYVAGLGKSRNDLTHSVIEQHIASTQELATALAKAGELTADKAAELASIKTAAEGFSQTIERVQSKVGSINQAADFVVAHADSSSGVGKAIIGHVLGGPAGAAAGYALNLTNITKRIAVEQMAERAQKVLGSTLDGFFTGIRTATAGGGELAGKVAESAGRFAKPIPILTSLELFQGKHATPEAAYKARVSEVLQADANYGQKIRDNAGRVFGAVADSDPHSVGAAVIATTKSIQLLKATLPAPLLASNSLTPQASRPMPSRMEIQQYADTWMAVSKPLEVLKQIPQGTPTQAQMAAIKQIYPKLYDWVRQETMGRLIALDRDGIEVPIRERMILDTLLDLNGAGEPTFTAQFAMKYGPLMRDLPDQAGPMARTSGGAGMGKRLQTKTDTFIGG